MNARTLRIWMVVAAVTVLAGWGLARYRERTGRPDARVGAPLIAFDINEVAALRVSAGAHTLNVARRDGQWVIETLYGYPADRGRIAERLLELSELKIGQVAPGGETELEEFGLDDTNATVVEFLAADGRRLARLALGKARLSASGGFGGFPDGQYVRVDDGPVVVLSRQLYGFSPEPRDWVRSELLNLSPSQGDRVEVVTAEGAYRLRVEEPGRFVLEDLREDEKLDEGMARRVVGALQYLSFTTIADPACSDEELGFVDPARYIYRTADGFIYTVQLGGAHQDGGRYARIAVAYERPVAEIHDESPEVTAGEGGTSEARAAVESETSGGSAEESAAVGKKPLDEETAQQNAKRAAEEHARLSRWTYVLSSWTAESLTLPRARLIQEPKVEDDETTAPAVESSGAEENNEEK